MAEKSDIVFLQHFWERWQTVLWECAHWLSSTDFYLIKFFGSTVIRFPGGFFKDLLSCRNLFAQRFQKTCWMVLISICGQLIRNTNLISFFNTNLTFHFPSIVKNYTRVNGIQVRSFTFCFFVYFRQFY